MKTPTCALNSPPYGGSHISMRVSRGAFFFSWLCTSVAGRKGWFLPRSSATEISWLLAALFPLLRRLVSLLSGLDVSLLGTAPRSPRDQARGSVCSVCTPAFPVPVFIWCPPEPVTCAMAETGLAAPSKVVFDKHLLNAPVLPHHSAWESLQANSERIC